MAAAIPPTKKVSHALRSAFLPQLQNGVDRADAGVRFIRQDKPAGKSCRRNCDRRLVGASRIELGNDAQPDR
jgi:hypothetical protein